MIFTSAEPSGYNKPQPRGAAEVCPYHGGSRFEVSEPKSLSRDFGHTTLNLEQ